MAGRFQKQTYSLISLRHSSGGVLLDCVPPPSHRDGEIELAVTGVFHPGGMSFKRQWSPVRSPHQDDEVQCVTVPASEKIVEPVELRTLWRFTIPLLQVGDDRGNKSINGLTHIAGHFGLRWRFLFRW